MELSKLLTQKLFYQRISSMCFETSFLSSPESTDQSVADYHRFTVISDHTSDNIHTEVVPSVKQICENDVVGPSFLSRTLSQGTRLYINQGGKTIFRMLINFFVTYFHVNLIMNVSRPWQNFLLFVTKFHQELKYSDYVQFIIDQLLVFL